MTTKTTPNPKTTQVAAPAAVLVMLPLDELAPHPDNVRRSVGDVSELAKSIAGTGVLEPLLVLPAGDDGRHLVVAGHRRLAAARKAKVDTVPAIVRDLTPAEVIEAMLVENLQRAEITPVEEARAYGRLVELDTKVSDIARKVGRSQPHVKGRLDLLALPDPVLDLVEAGDVTLSEASELVKLCADHPAAYDLLTATPDRSPWQIRRQIDEEAKAALLAEERAKLAKAGLTEFDKANWWQGWKLELNKPQEVAKLELGKAGSKHRLEPCHAVRLQMLGSSDGWRVERTTICTAPKRHTTLGAAKDRSELQADPALYATADSASPGAGSAAGRVDQAWESAFKVRQEALAARRAFAGKLIRTSRLPALDPFAAAQIVASAAEIDWPEFSEIYLVATGIDITSGDPDDGLEAAAADWWSGPADPVAAQAAAWAALLAAGLDSQGLLGPDDDLAWQVFDLLAGHGYEPGPWELDRQAARTELLTNRARTTTATDDEPADETPIDVDELGLSDDLAELLITHAPAGEVILPSSSELAGDLTARGWATINDDRDEGPGLTVYILTAYARRVAAALAVAEAGV
jgi:ParB/RepB/Spo0J family partition protein